MNPFFLKGTVKQQYLVYGYLSALLFSFYFLLRVLFYIAFGTYNGEFFYHSLYLGMKFDLRLVASQVLIFYFLTIIPKFIFKNYKFFHYFIVILFSLLQFAVFFIYFADFGHFSYLEARVNVSVLENLLNTHISLEMIWQSYPMIRILLGLLFLTVLFGYLWNKIFQFYLDIKEHDYGIKKKLAFRIPLFFLIALAFYGKFSYYPLRWSEAYFTPNNYYSQWALNPVLNFIETFSYKTESYDLEEVKKYYSKVSQFLYADHPDEKTLNYRRTHTQASNKKLNVVIVLLESLAANKTSMFDNKLDPTPSLNEIAKDALFYKKFFTPTEATARGVWAVLTGLPDIAETKSSSRNPHLVNQETIFGQFDGYKKMYFLGGSANWGNIRGLFSNNIPDVEIHEEGDYSSPRVDVWGISDLDLLKESHKVLEKTKEPFIAFIQTAGFHRPYTIPEDNEGFIIKHNIPEDKLTDYGFHSIEEYNSLRFADHAVGHFMKLAKESSYFDNTIFVFLGDHGIQSKRSLNMPKGYIELTLKVHHVPFILYSPKHIEPQVVVDKIGSQLDVLPTVATLAGIPWTTQTLGRNLLDPRDEAHNYAFIYSFHKPYLIGLVGPKYFYEWRHNKEDLFEYEDPDNPSNDLSKKLPAVTEEMRELTRGLYETTRYLRFENKKR
ncbi:MAG: sulfatase-like hydrolase/transferase [Halobacteriovoraceae bacterium]|nr:sulfatase-like hydrolase/transferase [Halobacteriovoraceae bacterium]